jgi:predicted dehydrogenase
VFGHAGRPGYEREWKTSKALCGGGSALDPGIHIIDLVRFLLDEVESVDAHLFRSFWDIDVEDNAFVLLRTHSGREASLHISITEWKNQFSFDILGTEGEIQIRGRGGFYGTQSLTLTTRWGWLQTPKAESLVKEYPGEDGSFGEELKAFFGRIAGEPSDGSLAGPADALRALEIIDGIYESSPVHDGRPVPAQASR